MNRINQGDIGVLFIGDSITDGWPRVGEWSWLNYAPYKPANFGVNGERTEDVIWRLTNGELKGIHPKLVVLQIGTNNIGQCRDEKPEWAAAGITKIVELLRRELPQSRILLIGLLPRERSGDPHLNDKIAEINRIISKLDDGKNVRYLDVGPVFLDGNGKIAKGVMLDGLHPNAHGYDLWYEAMNPLFSEMINSSAL